VEILREENTGLKKDLETYYQRVRKLQKVRKILPDISIIVDGAVV